MASGKRYTSEKDIARMFVRQSGLCGKAGCGERLTSVPKKNYIIEHILPLGMKGTDDLANKALYCVPCAKKKTYYKRSKATGLTSDIFEIAKTKSMEAKRLGTDTKKPKRAWPKGRKLQSRPWPKA